MFSAVSFFFVFLFTLLRNKLVF